MGKTGKWIRNFLTGSGKKDRDKNKINDQNYPSNTPISIPPLTPREKRRWSFRRSSATTPVPPPSESENEQTKHALAVAAATAAAAGAAVAAAQAAAAVVRLTAGVPTRRASAIEQAAAVKIQSNFRSYLARKALSALKGLVKLQALVRGHLVRKQATATLRCMEALVTVQARARAQRILMAMAEDSNPNHQIQSNHRKSTQDNRFRQSYQEMDRGMEENIKIVEMDVGESKGSSTIRSRNSYSNHPQTEQADHHRLSTHSAPHRGSYTKHDPQDLSPAPSALTDLSPRARSGHFEDYSFCTSPAVSKPEYPSYDYSMFPNYMANTESSRAKARSQSAPKSRPDSFDRLPNRRKVSLEGRNVPRAVRMQRSASGAGPVGQNYQCPWSVKLDRSSVSLKESECGSTSTVLTNTVYCRSLVGFDVHGNRY